VVSIVGKLSVEQREKIEAGTLVDLVRDWPGSRKNPVACMWKIVVHILCYRIGHFNCTIRLRKENQGRL
jgi:hypothetical protein